MRKAILLIVVFVALSALCASMSPMVSANVAASFAPPATITVKMYQLYDWGASKNVTCTDPRPEYYGRDKWGCTAYCTNSYHCTYKAPPRPLYPFSSENATVAIEGTNCLTTDSPYNCYLRDVVPEEVDIKASSLGNKPLSTVQAQAIAARTVTYRRYTEPGFNNSTAIQVFVPYFYDTLTTDQRNRVAAALNGSYYLSYADDTPIAAYYGADNRDRTSATPGIAYLLDVPDPISAEWGCFLYFDEQGRRVYGTNADCGTGSGGMSQKGASRWGFGHESSKGPVAEGSPNYPHDVDGLGNFWSVRWDNAYQILAHYYTGIHVRNANSNNAVLTPLWRGNVLQVKWSRPRGYPNGICSRIEVWLQNTGTTTWYGADQGYYGQQVGIGYCWNGGPCAKAGYLPKTIEPGHDLWVTLLVPPGSGSGDLQIDLYRQMFYEYDPAWFSLDWPRQGIGTFSAVPNYCTRLPLMTSREPIH